MMEQKIYNRLKKYEKNFKYILSTNRIYPMLTTRELRDVTQLYNTIFIRDVKVMNGCVSCGGYTELILRELAKYYYANTETETPRATETIEHQETGTIETLSSVPTDDEIAQRGDKDGQTVICDENYAEHNKCEKPATATATATAPVKKRSHHKKK